MERQLHEKEVRVKEVESEKAIACSAYESLETNSGLRSDIAKALHETVENYNEVVSTRIVKKLNGLYGGKIYLPNKTDSYLNLSSKALTEDQKDFLNLGLKGIIRPFSKILELFSRNGRQSWQMAGSDVFCLKIALHANARPSKLIRLPASTYSEQLASTCTKSL